jgi:hypothetical protein
LLSLCDGAVAVGTVLEAAFPLLHNPTLAWG